MSGAADTASPETTGADVDARLLGRGLVGLRIFVGTILFANGLTKLFSFRNIEVGPYRSFLINREETRSILEGEASRNELGFVKTIVDDVLLPNFGWLQCPRGRRRPRYTKRRSRPQTRRARRT